jgi:hypothetical protein
VKATVWRPGWTPFPACRSTTPSPWNAVQLRQRHGLKIPEAIILATARCAAPNLATGNSRDFPLTLGGVLHPHQL